MVKGALFVGYGTLITGREVIAQAVLAHALQYCAGLQDAKTIDSFEAVTLEPHGGELEGFMFVKGDKDILAQLRVDSTFVRMITDLRLVHTKVRVVGAYTGDEMQSLVEMCREAFEQLM